MKLKKLIKDLPIHQIKGSKDIEVTGICVDSRRAKPGDLFIARRGENYDGAEFIDDAISSGIVAVVTDLYNPSYTTITQLIHPQPQQLEGILSTRCYCDPSMSIFLVAITGTNGKTTTAHLIRHLFEKIREPTGLISTVETIIGSTHLPNAYTTLDVVQNHQLLKEMHTRKCTSAVMEATSHGLAQGRLEGLNFDIAIFTNITSEHLDYHKTMQKYAQEKKKLFSLLEKSKKQEKWAIFNADSSWSAFMQEGLSNQVLTYGIKSSADVRATNIELSSQQTRFTLTFQGKQLEIFSPLIGRFNVYNTLAAIACAICKGVEWEKLPDIVRTLPAVPGRLERVVADVPFSVFVDFAHTEDALLQVLQTLKEVAKGRILTVFGCGGNRDFLKRPRMAQVVEKFSDCIWVTNDNPRKEDPEKIAQQIVQGFSANAHFSIELDRKKAIEAAICRAREEDIVLIAGKGHETKQIFAHFVEEFDDREQAKKALKKRCTFC